MNKYKYNNHKTDESLGLEAEDILEADKIYMKLTGLNATKCMYIGIEIKRGIQSEMSKL